MKELAIRVENLGKLYKIGRLRTRYDTIRDKIAGLTKSCFRQSKASGSPVEDTNSDFIWALKGVSFEVKKGEILGFIGRNGAGKTTLLRILSRITEPTKGYAEIRGRVGSLLEVGTGFHPELTGRENIYLNGAILGMKKAEIDRKFDEIVAFAEIEKFLDTPVKRYSSGMYVRLAFAVAAHLEPEILLVDEVLAVGDAAFQKKCLGRMGDVAKEGRTVLFVSHNMGAIEKLCSRALLLTNGAVTIDGPTQEVIGSYLTHLQKTESEIPLYKRSRSGILGQEIRFSKCLIMNSEGKLTTKLRYGEPFSVYMEAIAKVPLQKLSLAVRIETLLGDPIAYTLSEDAELWFSSSPSSPLRVQTDIKGLVLTPGEYCITPIIRKHDSLPQAITFEVIPVPYEGIVPYSGMWGKIRIKPLWRLNE